MEETTKFSIKKLLKNISARKVKYVVGTVILAAVGVTLPQLFHLFLGSTAGATFLPMHIAVLLAALVFGGPSAILVASTSIVFSYAVTGMPNIQKLPFMLAELCIYGVLLSLFRKKFNNYAALIMTMISGRLIYSGLVLLCIKVFGAAVSKVSIVSLVKTGWPGLLIQLMIVPLLASALKKGLDLDEK